MESSPGLVAEQVKGPRGRLSTMYGIDRAAAVADFNEVNARVRLLGLQPQDTARISRLAHVGNLLLTLDLEDLPGAALGPKALDAALLAVSLPQAPSRRPAGLLASLLPTCALLIDVIQVRHQQRQVSQMLAAVHLLSEVLPLLAWEDVLGHAGDPAQLLKQVSLSDSAWGRPKCPSKGPGRSAAQKLEQAVRSPRDWTVFLERSWSRLGDQLADCARCRQSCSMAALAEGHRGPLAARLAISDAFAGSSLLGARHGSAVGHAFAVPDADEVFQCWRQTAKRLERLVPGLDQDDGHALPGLKAMVEAVAGRALPAASVLERVRSALDVELGRLDRLDPSGQVAVSPS